MAAFDRLRSPVTVSDSRCTALHRRPVCNDL